MGVSPAFDPDRCIVSNDKATDASQGQIAVLTDLLTGSAGKSANKISAALIEKYNSISVLLAAISQNQALDIALPDKVAECLLAMAGAFCGMWRHKALSGDVISNGYALHAYLHLDMMRLPQEHFRVLFLASDNHLIADELMWVGTVDSVQCHPREIVRAALAHGATAVILVHNHPRGEPSATLEDRIITRKIIDACATVDVKVHDHVIIGENGIYSMRDEQQIEF